MSLQPPDLSGRTAFITGTTRGIGKQIALALADAGCNIISTGKTVDDEDSDPSYTGNAIYDEAVLREAGVTDFSRYNLTEGDPLPLSAQMFDPEYERPTADTSAQTSS